MSEHVRQHDLNIVELETTGFKFVEKANGRQTVEIDKVRWSLWKKKDKMVVQQEQEMQKLQFQLVEKSLEINKLQWELKSLQEKTLPIQNNADPELQNMVASLLKNYSNISSTQQGFINSFVGNFHRSSPRFDDKVKDFWVDCYNNLSHRQFNQIWKI